MNILYHKHIAVATPYASRTRKEVRRRYCTKADVLSHRVVGGRMRLTKIRWHIEDIQPNVAITILQVPALPNLTLDATIFLIAYVGPASLGSRYEDAPVSPDPREAADTAM